MAYSWPHLWPPAAPCSPWERLPGPASALPRPCPGAEEWPAPCSHRPVDPVLKAIKEDDEGTLKAMIKAGKNLAEPNKEGWLPLHEAAYYGRESCLKALQRGEAAAVGAARGGDPGASALPPGASCSLTHNNLGEEGRARLSPSLQSASHQVGKGEITPTTLPALPPPETSQDRRERADFGQSHCQLILECSRGLYG